MIGEWDPDAAPARWTSWSHAVSEMFDVARQVRDVGPESESSRQLWIARVADFDALAADMRSDALADGADPGWIEDACLFGIQVGIDPGPPGWRHRPARQHSTEVFFVDLLHLDLWHLERTAALQLAYEKRVRFRSGDARADLERERALSDRTDLRRRRVSGVVAGARITVQEGEELWGTGAEWMRRMHAGAVNRMSEDELAEMWNAYADAHVPLLWPPYLLTDPDTGKPLRPNLTEPPSTEKMIAQAAAASAAVAAAAESAAATGRRTRRGEDTDQPGADSSIAAAVQATNPGSYRDPERPTGLDGKPETEPEPELPRATPVCDLGLDHRGRDE
ncbi:hypothetical protein ACIO52_02620 [Nocardia sp. NPDC087230]|uniref:hypothetical protein n=1 Tax=Nocardia sp. NPDC087230 TaxID=3364331 RepID=UPI003829C4D6